MFKILEDKVRIFLDQICLVGFQTLTHGWVEGCFIPVKVVLFACRYVLVANHIFLSHWLEAFTGNLLEYFTFQGEISVFLLTYVDVAAIKQCSDGRLNLPWFWPILLAPHPRIVPCGVKGSVDFFGVSGLTYVADFARWWASQQAPEHPATKAFLEAGVLESGAVWGVLPPSNQTWLAGKWNIYR